MRAVCYHDREVNGMDSKTSEAQKRAVLKYDAKNTKQYHLKLNLTTDAALIEYLDSSGNIQGTIKAALIEYMSRK